MMMTVVVVRGRADRCVHASATVSVQADQHGAGAVHLVSLYELVGVRVRAKVVICLDASVLDRAGSDYERGEYGAIDWIGRKRTLDIIFTSVADHKLNYLGEESIEQGETYPEEFVAVGAFAERVTVAVRAVGDGCDSGACSGRCLRARAVGSLVLVAHSEYPIGLVAFFAYLLHETQRRAAFE